MKSRRKELSQFYDSGQLRLVVRDKLSSEAVALLETIVARYVSPKKQYPISRNFALPTITSYRFIS